MKYTQITKLTDKMTWIVKLRTFNRKYIYLLSNCFYNTVLGNIKDIGNVFNCNITIVLTILSYYKLVIKSRLHKNKQLKINIAYEFDLQYKLFYTYYFFKLNDSRKTKKQTS